jgi:hypothetical protein
MTICPPVKRVGVFGYHVDAFIIGPGGGHDQEASGAEQLRDQVFKLDRVEFVEVRVFIVVVHDFATDGLGQATRPHGCQPVWAGGNLSA